MKQRYRCRLGGKGFLQLDFAFLVLIFVTFFTFSYYIYNNYNESVSDVLVSDYLKVQARDACFLLSSSPGFPNSWEDNLQLNFTPGLREVGSRNLSASKIANFTEDNYYDILDSLKIDANVGIKIVGINTSTTYLNFGVFASDFGVLYSDYVCYANYNSEIVKLFVEVWK